MSAFLSNLSLRNSCYNCSCKAGKSNADITLGDFWGVENIHPELDYDKGISAVILHTALARKALIQIQNKLKTLPVSADMILQNNQAYLTSVKKIIMRRFYFMSNYHRDMNVAQKTPFLLSIHYRIINQGKKIFKRK